MIFLFDKNNVVITEKSTVAELFNNPLIQAAISVAQTNDSDYGQDFKSHPSIIDIHHYFSDTHTADDFVSLTLHC